MHQPRDLNSKGLRVHNKEDSKNLVKVLLDRVQNPGRDLQDKGQNPDKDLLGKGQNLDKDLWDKGLNPDKDHRDKGQNPDKDHRDKGQNLGRVLRDKGQNRGRVLRDRGQNRGKFLRDKGQNRGRVLRVKGQTLDRVLQAQGPNQLVLLSREQVQSSRGQLELEVNLQRVQGRVLNKEQGKLCPVHSSQVCSLCGFSPPDSAGKEWLCLNCQMQRAMGGMDPPNPRQGSVPPSPQKQAPGKPGNLLIKQQSHQSDQGLTPPTTPRQKSPGPTSSGPPSPGSSMAGSPKIDPKTGKPIMQKSSPQQSPSKAKQESSFFGGFGLGGLTDSVKSSSTSSQSESVTGKLFGGFGGLMETSKPPAQTAPKQEESVAGKLFSGFGGLSDSSSKPPAAASQMFSFGSSLLSSATNLVTGDDSTPAEPSGSPPQSPDSGPGSPPDSPFSAPGSPPDSDSAPDTPPARFTKPTKSMSIDAEKKPASTAPTQSCPLCNVELSMGSSDMPNYSLCTECKKTVCNLCGFNPMPHLGEKEWLCLNCQTQRAMAGQLGDEPPPVMGSPKKQPPPAPVAPTSTSTSTSTTPTPAPASVETKPVVEPSALNPDVKVKTTEQAPTEKAPETTGSPTGLSDLTKLENTVLPILEAKPKPEEDTLVDTPKTRRKLEVLPIMPDSPSSEEERETLEQNVKEKKKLLVPMDIRGDSLEDSSESIGKESPMSGDDEDFLRKQIIEMSENEDASPTDEENVIRQKIKEQEKNTASVEKSASGRGRRLTKKATISPDEDEDKHLEEAAAKVVQEGKESKPDDSGPAVRQFQTMELNAPSMKIATSEGEVEMECLTDSPDDRSKGEGSSSLHASSFTPGTSPTSMSSFDEDSDSSSPSNMSTGEGKQQRKAKHRQPGQLPTIEDSSEEEELREEEELLREQEKQKSSGKKSKRDKEDKSQRRRERSKTPPSNLSPIEDASPTEELRQEAEMEEMRRSSCSDFSPSLESDPEGFEIHASKIAAFQKSYKLPVSSDSLSEDKTKKPLKTADETYEEIMLRAKSPTTEKVDNQPEKEALYGGMLIEDYAYTSLIDNSTNEKEEPERMALPTQPKKLRSPDEVYEDMLKKRKEFQKLEEEYQKMQPKQEPGPTPEIVLQPAENINNPPTITTDTDGKPLLDADTAYEELMRKVLTPTSPSQQDQDVETTPAKRALYPIPDLKVTQCSSGELSSDEEFYKKEEEPETPEPPPVRESSKVSPSEPSDVIVTTSGAAVDLSGLSKATPLMCSVTPLPTVPQYTPAQLSSRTHHDPGPFQSCSSISIASTTS
uniref:Zinc finger piccolo-type domain-containing protein n=1 Tax=Knipowitschia caucasica TaxID=637954 RepID=A0AAV2IY74_KNICA